MKCIIEIAVAVVYCHGDKFTRTRFDRFSGKPKVVGKWLEKKRLEEGYNGFIIEKSTIYFNEQVLIVGRPIETKNGYSF
jgi:hypothetical protein